MNNVMMALVRCGDVVSARSRFEEKDVLKEAGFRWDNDDRDWKTNDPNVVARLKQLAELQDIEVIEKEVPHVEFPATWKNHPSNALDWDGELPAPPDKEYYPFQKAGIVYCRGKRNVLIADDMGLGKTIQAIGVMNDEPIKTALIICPSGVKVHWQRTLDEWLNYFRSIGIAQGAKIWPDTDIVITNWESVAKQRQHFMRQEWDMVVFDEVHYIKNQKAKRTTAVLGDPSIDVRPVRAKRVVALSGTPVENRPSELWTILKYMMPKVFNDWWHFSLCYCKGNFARWGYDDSGASNLRTLGAILRQSIMIRRLKRQVRTQLPPLTREVFYLDAGAAASKAVAEEKGEFEGAKARVNKLMDQAKTDSERMEARMEAASVLGLMMGIRRRVALAKIKSSVALFRDLIESERIMVFCYHRDVIDGIAKEFKGKHLIIDGRTKDKQKIIDEFVADDSKRILIGQIEAAGTGIDGIQHVCNHVLHVEIDFRPGKVSQCESRVDRGGQKFAVRSTFLVIRDSFDDELLKGLDAKEEVIDQLMN